MKTLGILGDGQLGRMTALAAARLGVRCVILGPGGRDSPGGQVAWESIKADYSDEAALARFADLVDVATYEFENVPTGAIDFLERRGVPVRPGQNLLAVSQDRAAEKSFLNSIGIPTAPWRTVQSAEDIPLGEGLLKTLRLGYDGRGQARLGLGDDPAKALESIGGGPALWEGFVDFATECSVIIARGIAGDTVTYGPTRNMHEGGILRTSIAPAGLSNATEQKALEMAHALAEATALIGVVALELFVLPDGALLANEIAPRPHNSGHWTIDACAASQFENHARAVLGMPLAPPARHSNAVMENLIGQDGLDTIPPTPERGGLGGGNGICLHLYGKDQVRPGRKMGHVTFVSPK